MAGKENRWFSRGATVLRSLPFQMLVGCVLFWLYHNRLDAWMRHRGMSLGELRPGVHFAPFYARVHVGTWFTAWTIPAVAVLVVLFLLVRCLYLKRQVGMVILMPVTMLFFVSISVAVAQIDGMTRGPGGRPVPYLLEPYTRAAQEYYADVPKVEARGLRGFLRDYHKPELFMTLSAHAQTHPPGGSIFQWLSSKLFGHRLWSAALSTIVFTSLGLMPLFLLARLLHGAKVARYALALALVVPSYQMFTATCMDGPFSVFPIWSVFLFFRALYAGAKARLGWATLAGLATGLAVFMNYAALFLGIFYTFFLGFLLLRDRARFEKALLVSVTAACGFVLFFGLLFVISGFDFAASLGMAIRKDAAVMGAGYHSPAHYVNVCVANLVAFLVGMGMPLLVVCGRQWTRSLRRLTRNRTADLYLLAFVPALFVAAFATLFNLEVERIWLFMLPFLVIPAARYTAALCRHRQDLFVFYWTAVLMAVQMVLTEAALFTYW